jgi:hypothetical protein
MAMVVYVNIHIRNPYIKLNVSAVYILGKYLTVVIWMRMRK